MTYIPEDVQLIILEYVPNKIDPLRPLSLCCKNFSDLLFSRLEPLYWKKIERIFGKDNAQMMFSGLKCGFSHMKWSMSLRKVHSDKDLILLEKGLKQMKEENRSFKLIDIRNALITEKTEYRLRDFWTRLGKSQECLRIRRVQETWKSGQKIRGCKNIEGTLFASEIEKVKYKALEEIPNLIQRMGYSSFWTEPLIGENYAWV